jgi:hypothetical protein
MLYAFTVGLGYGILYMLTLKHAWVYFPNRKGMVGGIILSCYSFGAIAWSFLCTELSNPNNEQPKERVILGRTFELVFDL